jgi:hypothetical protein
MPEIILTGAIASLLRLAMPDTNSSSLGAAAPSASGHDMFESSVKLVAGARFERAAFRL